MLPQPLRKLTQRHFQGHRGETGRAVAMQHQLKPGGSRGSYPGHQGSLTCGLFCVLSRHSIVQEVKTETKANASLAGCHGEGVPPSKSLLMTPTMQHADQGVGEAFVQRMECGKFGIPSPRSDRGA